MKKVSVKLFICRLAHVKIDRYLGQGLVGQIKNLIIVFYKRKCASFQKIEEAFEMSEQEKQATIANLKKLYEDEFAAQVTFAQILHRS